MLQVAEKISAVVGITGVAGDQLYYCGMVGTDRREYVKTQPGGLVIVKQEAKQKLIVYVMLCNGHFLNVNYFEFGFIITVTLVRYQKTTYFIFRFEKL